VQALGELGQAVALARRQARRIETQSFMQAVCLGELLAIEARRQGQIADPQPRRQMRRTVM
jgi:hypothetical protein